MRLDKYLSSLGLGTRSEVKKIISKKEIMVNDKIITDSGFNINEDVDKVYYHNNELHYQKYYYFMLNKPAGYVTSTEDPKSLVVTSLIKGYEHLNLFPVGRLDKDTTGLLILTNDGDFAHKCLSPNHHVEKEYLAVIDHEISDEDIKTLEEGIILDGKKTKPAKIKYLNNNTYSVIITEGKYHQIKRMFHHVSSEVINLKRIRFSIITLDDKLDEGCYNIINNELIEQLKSLIH